MDMFTTFANTTVHILNKQVMGTEAVLDLVVDEKAIPGCVLVENPHFKNVPLRQEDDAEIAKAIGLIVDKWPDAPIILHSWVPDPSVWPETLRTALEHGITQVAISPGMVSQWDAVVSS